MLFMNPNTTLPRMISRSVLMLLLVFISRSMLAQNVNIIVSPATSSTQVGQTFTVSVVADFTGAATLNGIDAFLNFNPADLQVVSTPTVPAGTQSMLEGVSVPFASVATMNSLGRVDHGRFTTNGNIAAHPSSDFTLFSVTFQALRVPPGGNTALSFNTALPRQTNASEGSTVVLNQTINGTVTITSNCTPPTATISNTSTCNGQAFSLTLANATGTGPYSLTVNGNVYSNVAVGGSFGLFTPPVEKVYTTNPVTNSYGPDTDPPSTGAPAVELGVKFRTSVTGFVKGVRFYAPDMVSGTYTGHLWSAAGILLASATFSNVTPNGWQEVTFATPIQIPANTTYIVSYHSTYGRYRATVGGYNSAGASNGSITILRNGVDGGNGLFKYGPSSFPNQSVNATNYWVDVLFSPAVYSFNLTSVASADGCTNTGSLQTLVVTSVECGTLPVRFVSLAAAAQEPDRIVLNWSTAEELNNRGFQVERSVDGVNWTAIGFVPSDTRSQDIRRYTYTDERLTPARYYYRVKQIDFDNNYRYSIVVSATLGSAARYILEQNVPNPANGQTAIRYTLAEGGQVMLTLLDASGRQVKVLTSARREAGSYVEYFDPSGLAKGVYFYKLVVNEFSAVKKMFVQ